MDNKSLPVDVWEAAKLIWENTPKITDSELIKQLEITFGDDAPKSTGTISKRRSKYKWQKNTLSAATKRRSKQEADGKQNRNNRNKKDKNNSTIPSKTNKAQKRNNTGALEAKSGIIDDVIDDIVVDAKGRAKIITKYRRRYKKLGELFDQTLDITLSIKDLADDVTRAEEAALIGNYGANFEIGENAEAEPSNDIEIAAQRVKKAMALSGALTNTTTSLAIALKAISEVDMPMLGITADDFKQSEQARRLGALSALGDIDKQEREARTRLLPELRARLSEIIDVEASDDFGSEYDDPIPEDGIDDIDYTSVDD